MSFRSLSQIGPLRRVLYHVALWRVREKVREIARHLKPNDRVLDVGSGNCVLCEQLQNSGYRVIPIDLENNSFVDSIKPLRYDGNALPFADRSFDVALVVTVLHHTHDPDAVLSDVRRVANTLIIIEEIYDNKIGKYLTYAIDSLFNLEFFDHPHSNRTDAGWKAAFQNLGLDLRVATYSRSLGILQRVTYVLSQGTATIPPCDTLEPTTIPPESSTTADRDRGVARIATLFGLISFAIYLASSFAVREFLREFSRLIRQRL